MIRSSRSAAFDDRNRPALEVEHAGVIYRVAVKRVGTARRFTLRVRAATHDAVLTMPSRASLRAARAFAERNAEWIGTRLSGLPEPILLMPGTIVPVRGVDHLILHASDSLRRSLVQTGETGPGALPALRVAGTNAQIGRRLADFFRREALADLEASAGKHAESLGRGFDRITVRDTRSRWGSCSSKGTLSFSWRLILAPPFVLDYLAAHEVAHLAHLDHSAAFWALAGRLAPQVEAAELWLKRHGSGLHRFVLPG